MEDPKHFVLVHGACHGAWCWYKLVALLHKAGHRATALDLGASGINSKQLHEVATVWDYIRPLMEFMASIPLGERVILVGHSYGGIPISLAVERFRQKVFAAVFVTAYMPHYNSPPVNLMQEFFKWTPVDSLMDCKLAFGHENQLASVLFGPEYIAAKLYKHCKSEDLELAKMLIRPSGLYLEDMSKDGLLSEARFGVVTRVFVMCEGDQVMVDDFQQWMIKNGPTADVVVIQEAGHMVMLTKSQQLCQCLCEVAEKMSKQIILLFTTKCLLNLE